MNGPMWYRVEGSVVGDGAHNFFRKMKRDGFPKISMSRWKNYYPNDWNGPEMHEWMEEARIQCWAANNRPRSSKAIESMIRHMVQTTDFSQPTDRQKNHLEAIMMMRIAAIESEMMEESSADEYYEMNFPT